MCGDEETREHITYGGPPVEREDGAPHWVAQPAAVKRSPPNSCPIKPMGNPWIVSQRDKGLQEKETRCS